MYHFCVVMMKFIINVYYAKARFIKSNEAIILVKEFVSSNKSESL